MSRSNDRRELDVARAKFRNDLETFNNLVEVKVSETKETVTKATNSLNLKRHFNRHFWLTAGALVGAGLLLARPTRATKILLSSGQMNQLVKATEQKVLQSGGRSSTHSLTDGLLAIGSVLSSSVVSTLASIAFDLVREKFSKKEHQPEHKNEYSVH